MKPWARIEINYINHPKFLALNANALCLWHEGKNYSDMHLMDGMIRLEALKTFRFHSAKSVELLTRSCGLKPNGEPYAPLWERLDIGGVAHYRMHDYLDHNDCRDKVVARIAKAEKSREDDRQRKADARAAKAAKNGPAEVRALSGDLSDRTSAGHPPEIRSNQKQNQNQKEPKDSPPKGPADPRVREFLMWFVEEYKLRRFGADYLVKWGKHSTLVKPMLKITSLERLQNLARILLSEKTDDEFIVNSDRGIEVFSAKFNWLSERLARFEAGRKAGAA